MDAAPLRYFEDAELLVGRTWRTPPPLYGKFEFAWPKHHLGSELLRLNALPPGLPKQHAVPPDIPNCLKPRKNRLPELHAAQEELALALNPGEVEAELRRVRVRLAEVQRKAGTVRIQGTDTDKKQKRRKDLFERG
jgi:hypothetical protein